MPSAKGEAGKEPLAPRSGLRGFSRTPATLAARAASGLEAGVIGGLAMLSVLISFSLLRGRVWWESPNLLGSTFYGLRAFRSGVGMATLSGIAFHLVITGTVGVVFGLVCGAMAGRSRLLLLGLTAGVVWYYLANALLWSQLNPLVPLYTFPPAALVSHGVFGACLGWMGQVWRLSPETPDTEEDRGGGA